MTHRNFGHRLSEISRRNRRDAIGQWADEYDYACGGWCVFGWCAAFIAAVAGVWWLT